MKEKRETLAYEIWNYTRDRLVAALPLMSQAFLRLPLDLHSVEFADSRICRCGTDGQKIFWDIDSLLPLFKNDPDAPGHHLLHMVIHCIYTHMYAYDRLEPGLWDVACDIAAEYVLDQFRVIDKPSAVKAQQADVYEKMSSAVRDMTAEQIYRLLKQDPAMQEYLAERASAFAYDDHSLWASRVYDSADSDLTIYTKAAEFFDEKKEWKQIFQTISRLKEERSLYEGSMPGVQHVYLGSLTTSERNYARILRRFACLEEETELDPDAFDMIFYTYGLSLYGNLPLIEPLEYKESFKIRELAIAIDTSGSCQGDKVTAFLENTCAILAGKQSFFDRFRVTILQCDSKVQKEDTITSKEELERYMCDMEIHGAGGTDFRPVFTHLEEKLKDGSLRSLQGLLYFTDGLGRYPEKEPSFKTLFIYPDDKERRHPTPDWAESVML